MIQIEKFQTAKSTKTIVRLDDGTTITEKPISLAEAWKIEISCSNAGWKSELHSEIVGNAVYTKITWRK